MAGMTASADPRTVWNVSPAPVSAPEAAELLREYYIDVSDRYYRHHLGRPSTAAEIEHGLAGFSSDDLAPPDGVFLIARHGDDPAGCVGLRLLDRRTAELVRLYVRPAYRQSGGGATLLAAAEAAARDLGASRLLLDTRLDLTEARALYLHHGYAEIPHKPGPAAQVWYTKQLS
jgi:GNAT superfamily N-acetyltransferase